MRRALLILAGISALAAAGFAASSIQVAIAALAVSWLCGLAWVVLWARRTSTRINEVLSRTNQVVSRTNRAAAELDRAAKRQRAIHERVQGMAVRIADQGRVQQQTANQLKVTRREIRQVLIWVQRTPSVTQELGRAYDRVIDHDRPMPELGDWAMSASTLLWVLDRISDESVRTILECGSGSSTVWFATALAHRGGEGQVIALESSAEYAEMTRAELARHGLQDRAVVLHAPLIETVVADLLARGVAGERMALLGFSQGACLTSEFVAKKERLETIEGVVPRPTDLPSGCHFAPRCPHRMPRCTDEAIPLYALDEGVQVRCVLYDLAAAVSADHRAEERASE